MPSCIGWILVCATLTFLTIEISSQDTGSVENCGDASSSKFTLTWSPKRVPLGGTVTLNGDMTASSSLDSEGDQVCYTVWLPDVPDPIVPRQCTDFNCDIIHKFVDFFPCPISAGQQYSKHDIKIPVESSYPIPTGIFIAKAEVFNANKTMFLCARVQLEIYSPDDDTLAFRPVILNK